MEEYELMDELPDQDLDNKKMLEEIHSIRMEEEDILTKLFAEELGYSYELVYGYYGRSIEEIEDTDDIHVFTEICTEDILKSEHET